MDDDASRARAALPSTDERTANALNHCLPKVSIIHHDGCITSAHLQSHHAAGTVEVGFHDAPTNWPTSSEEHSVDIRMRHKGGSNIAATLHRVEYASRHARFIHQLSKQRANCRSLLAWLKNHRIACIKRRNPMPIGQMRREVERTDHRHHAVRPVRTIVGPRGRCRNLIASNARTHAIFQSDIDFVREQRRFLPRLSDGLARLTSQ